MSDFDREAEREKLREKYERDKQKREASERMSELLLQGATMTNRHCPECQSPVFRHDGRAFCPTCEKEITEAGDRPEAGEESAAADGTAGADETEPADADVGIEASDSARTPAPGDSAGSETARDIEPSDDTGAGATGTDDRPDPPESHPPPPASDRRPARIDPPATTGSDPDEGHRERDTAGSRVGTQGSERGTLREAERTLVAEIGSLTRRAEETRDVGRKRDLLAAAREAAETLESVRRL